MKSNRIVQIIVLTALLVLSVAGAPRPPAIHTARLQPPHQPQNGATVVANKTVSQAQANPGDMLTYSITLTNTNVLSPLATLLTDTLPLSLAFQPASLTASEGAIAHTAQVITWSGVITPSGVVTISLQAQVLQPSTTITNVAVFNAGEGPVFSPVASTTVGPAHLYLPLVSRPQPGIFGHVTLNGSPAAGVPLLLRFFNGSAWSTAASLSTDGNGAYQFNPSALNPGQKYYVLFRNTTEPSELYVWGTRELLAYQPTDTVFLGTFDIADIVSTAPAPGALVNLPYNFQWTVRPASPTDSYEFNLTVPDPSQTPYFFTDPPLGYVGSYVLAHLPDKFQTQTAYIWFMWVYDQEGGYGIAYYYRYVGFANAGSAQTSGLSTALGRTADVAPLLREQK